MRRLRIPFLFICFLVPPVSASAHTLGQSYLFLRVYEHAIEIRAEITIEDLERVLGLDLPASDAAPEEMRAHLDAVRAYLEARLRVEANRQALPLRFVSHDVLHIEIGDYVQLHYVIDGLEQIPDYLDITYAVLFEVDLDHRNLLVVEHNWKTSTFNNASVVSLIFSPISPQQTLDLSDSSVLRGLVGLVQLGTWHIWIGLDHILFLLALVLPAVLQREEGRWVPVGSFRQAFLNIVAIVTFFTIAHSITLSLAALEIVQLPARLVESIIAASIAVAALHNLYPRINVREWVIAFVFGLFHGLGFASVLTDIGLERGYLALSLLGFNLGVEIGQVAIIGAVFPILYALRKKGLYMHLLRYGSLLLIAIAMLWFVERLFDLPLLRYARGAARLLYHRLTGGV